MRCFICDLDGISLGIPAEHTERIIAATREQTSVYETENEEVFISLPLLFRKKDSTTPHGIVLKSPHGTLPDSPSVEGPGKKVRTVLLTPKIDIDMEIPEEHIHKLPVALTGLLHYFKGAYFSSQNMILILNPEFPAELQQDGDSLGTKSMERCDD